jgi:hypothetical protein
MRLSILSVERAALGLLQPNQDVSIMALVLKMP